MSYMHPAQDRAGYRQRFSLCTDPRLGGACTIPDPILPRLQLFQLHRPGARLAVFQVVGPVIIEPLNGAGSVIAGVDLNAQVAR